MKREATQTIAKQTAATMRSHVRSLAFGSVAVFALSGWLALPAIAQQASGSDAGSGQSSSSSTQNKQQGQPAPPAHKNAAQENPFPADVSKHAAQQQSQPPDAPTGAPAAPDTDQQAPQPAHKTAAQENPFPEDVSKGAAAAAAKDSNADSSSSSSSSSGSSSSNTAGDTDPNADPNGDLPRDTGRRRLKKPSDKDIQSGSLAGEGRAQDDVRVGRFYLGSGDFKGAYGRYSEAMRLDPTNLDAIYGLAAAAAGLHHTDEALTNYKLYLQIAPDGNDARSARKALRALSK
jgi:tetratricopeptide (TPR) repeat protein